MNHRETFLLVFVLGLAGLLRMGWPGLTEFKQDEAHLYSLALSLAEFRAFPLHGISFSVGLPNSPLSVYLYALPLFVWKSPIAATLFLGLLNTAAVGLAYLLVRRYWGARAALISALLYATAPWAVLYSRKIWSNNLLPLFIVGAIFSGLLAWVEGRRKWLSVHLVLLLIAILIHIYAVALVPLTAVLLLLFRQRIDWRVVAYAVGGVIAVILTAGVYILSRPDWILYLKPVLSQPVQITTDALWMSAMIVQGTQMHSLAGPEAFRAFEATIPNFNPILWLGGAMVLAGIVYVVWGWIGGRRESTDGTDAADVRRTFKVRRTSAAEAGLVIALWLLIPILFFTPHLTPVFPHYLAIIFPAPYLLSGIFLDGMLARLQLRWQRIGIWLLPLLIAGSQVWLWLALLRFVSTQATPQAFGTPLKKLLEVAETAKRIGTEDILVISQGSYPSIDFVPAVFEVLLHDVPHRFIDGRTTAVFPPGESTVILWPGADAGADLYQWWGGGQWSGTVALRAGEGDVHFARGTGIVLVVPHPRAASALLSNGAELLGSGGDAAHWELWWRAPGAGEGESYHVFAHVLDANGERLAQVDAPTYALRDWRENDLVVNYFEFKAEGAAVRAGMYAYPSLTPVEVLDAEGNPAGGWIEFPLD